MSVRPYKISSAIGSQRKSPIDSLDFYPTPGYSTRAFIEQVLWREFAPATLAQSTCWEPAAGEGHMVSVLKEYFGDVRGTDVHDYGRGFRVGSFVESPMNLDVAHWKGPKPCDFIITNPPFNLATEFAERGIHQAAKCCALLVRTAWLEGADRYERFFSSRPPYLIAQYAERVTMVQGRIAEKRGGATAYAWLMWVKNRVVVNPKFIWIPPGARRIYTRDRDFLEFAGRSADEVPATPVMETQT